MKMSDWEDVREIAYTKKDNHLLPFFSPWVWAMVTVIIFLLGVICGAGLAYYTLSIRGLI